MEEVFAYLLHIIHLLREEMFQVLIDTSLTRPVGLVSGRWPFDNFVNPMFDDCSFNWLEAQSKTEDVLQFMTWVSKCIFKPKEIDRNISVFSHIDPVFEPGIVCFCHTSLETDPMFLDRATCQCVVECQAMAVSVDIIEKRHIGVKFISRAYHNKVMLIPGLKGEDKGEMRFRDPSAIVFYSFAFEAWKLQCDNRRVIDILVCSRYGPAYIFKILPHHAISWARVGRK